jgi:hypothetical protein
MQGTHSRCLTTASIRASLESKSLSEKPPPRIRISNAKSMQAKCNFREALFNVIGNTTSLETAARVGLVAQRCVDVHAIFEKIDTDNDQVGGICMC